MGRTVTRSIRFEPEELAKLERVAASRGETANDVMRSLVRDLSEGKPKPPPEPMTKGHVRGSGPLPKVPPPKPDRARTSTKAKQDRCKHLHKDFREAQCLDCGRVLV